MKKRIPYLLIYYVVFVAGYIAIKHFSGLNRNTFEQLKPGESNFVGAALTVLIEIVIALGLAIPFLLMESRQAIGRFIVWATATVIPMVLIILVTAHFVLDAHNKKLAIQARDELHQEIISRLPKNVFVKKSGAKDDFSGYVTNENDSLGLIMADSNSMARVYVYIDSAKLGAIDLDSCNVCNAALRQRLSTFVIPLQSFSVEEVKHNLGLIDSSKCYVADRHIYLDECRHTSTRFIIINHVYDKVRHLYCYEIGFQVDCKTSPAQPVSLF